jgi:uncharacterized membrane protein YeaQ/YmgE (transglycosylase-associated protein family)
MRQSTRWHPMISSSSRSRVKTFGRVQSLDRACADEQISRLCPHRVYRHVLRAGRSMSTVVFVLIGMAACGFTRGLFNTTLGGFLLDLCLGVIGAVAAGSLFNYYIGVKIAQLYIASGLIAISGAALLLAACHAALWVAGYRQLDGRRVRIGGMAPLPSVPGAGRP